MPHNAAVAVMSFDNSKAGLQAVDKDKTEAIIQELSRNSPFYQNEERKAKQRQRRIEKLQEKSRLYDSSVVSRRAVLQRLQQEVDQIERDLEQHRTFSRVYVHVDMDMFYAAVEMKKDPQLATVPLGVGGISMLSTTNYMARQYGVRSGMPGFIGRHLCPALVILPCDYDTYRVESDRFKAVVRRYDRSFQSMGLDEVTMDLTPYIQQQDVHAIHFEELYDRAEEVVSQLRREILEATQLTASAGVAPTAMLAKMASNYKKPNGQSVLRLPTREEVLKFLAAVPVRQAPGIGKSQESILGGLGIATLGDVYQNRYRLFYLLTPKTYRGLLSIALGMNGIFGFAEVMGGDPGDAGSSGEARAGDESRRKSIGQERTFPTLRNRAELQAIAYRNLRDAHNGMTEEGLVSRLVVLKLKHCSFQVRQYSKDIHLYTDDYTVLQRAVDELLTPLLRDFASYRLLGVRLEKLRRSEQICMAPGVAYKRSGGTEKEGDGDDEEEEEDVGNDEGDRPLVAEVLGSQMTLQRFFHRHQKRADGRGGTGGCSPPVSDTEVVLISSGSQLIDVEEVSDSGGDTTENCSKWTGEVNREWRNNQGKCGGAAQKRQREASSSPSESSFFLISDQEEEGAKLLARVEQEQHSDCCNTAVVIDDGNDAAMDDDVVILD